MGKNLRVLPLLLLKLQILWGFLCTHHHVWLSLLHLHCHHLQITGLKCYSWATLSSGQEGVSPNATLRRLPLCFGRERPHPQILEAPTESQLHQCLQTALGNLASTLTHLFRTAFFAASVFFPLLLNLATLYSSDSEEHKGKVNFGKVVGWTQFCVLNHPLPVSNF